MPLPRQRRKRKTVKKKRDWREIVFYALSAAVAISMALGYVIANLASR